VVRSAREVVPLLIDLIHPQRVQDVECGGVDTWLSVFRAHGCDVIGVDGAYVDARICAFRAERFGAHDLGAWGRR
jgi:hypothetical protein